MARKLIAGLITLAMAATLAGCGQQPEEGTVEAFVPTGEISAESVSLDMTLNEDGYYSMFADVTVDFGDDGLIQAVEVDNTALLAFKVSSYYPGGVYLYAGEDMQGLQQKAIDEMDDEWEKELDARNKAKAGIEEE